MAQGEVETLPWRSTVVPDGAALVVRTWLRTPREAERPIGPPDVVHRVETVGREVVVLQVHPALGGAPRR